MSLIQERLQKAIDLLMDEQFTKLTHAFPEDRLDMLSKEHKAAFLELIPMLIEGCINERKEVADFVEHLVNFSFVSLLVFIITLCVYTSF